MYFGGTAVVLPDSMVRREGPLMHPPGPGSLTNLCQQLGAHHIADNIGRAADGPAVVTGSNAPQT